MKRLASERGNALIETALTLPLVLLVSVSSRAFQTWEVLTNAAREGARVAVLPGSTANDVRTRVAAYLASGQLDNAANATVVVNQAASVMIGANAAPASLVTVNYPFSFIVLQPVAQLLVNGSTLGAPFTMAAKSEMRNEQ